MKAVVPLRVWWLGFSSNPLRLINGSKTWPASRTLGPRTKKCVSNPKLCVDEERALDSCHFSKQYKTSKTKRKQGKTNRGGSNRKPVLEETLHLPRLHQPGDDPPRAVAYGEDNHPRPEAHPGVKRPRGGSKIRNQDIHVQRLILE